MSENRKRNQPCMCGSGEKYKKCCGANEAISITQVLEGEIDDLQQRLIFFALDHFEEDIEEGFEDFQEVLNTEDEQERQFYEFVHTIWFALFITLEDGQTILEKFIASEVGKIKRSKLKQILQSWTAARTIAGKVISTENNVLTVEDGFSSDVVEAVVSVDQLTIEKGVFFIGFLLPFEQKYVFFPAPFDLKDLPYKQAIDFIKQTSQNADYDSPQAFLTDFFMEIMNDLPAVGEMVDIEEMEWPGPIYQEVAEIFQKKLESLGVPTPLVDLGVILWFKFCQQKKKRIQNPKLYSAALHYLISLIEPTESPYTQKDIAGLYGVSAGTVSSVFRELEHELSEDIIELIGTVDGKEEVPSIKQHEQAQVLAFPTNRNIK